MSHVQPTDWNAKLTAWFIHNTQLVVLVFLTLIIGGGASFITLRREGFPSPDIGIAIINTTYKGASSEEVEQAVVKPLETAAQATKGVEEVRSTSYPGMGIIQVSFQAGYDTKAGIAELRNKIQNVSLPMAVDKPDVTVPEIGGNSSYYALVGASQAQLRTAGETFIQELEAVAGVQDLKPMDELTDQVKISWRPTDLAAKGLTPLSLQQALAGNNLTMPAGSIQTDSRTASVVTQGSFTSSLDVANTVIGTVPQQIRVKDVAQVQPLVMSKEAYTAVGYKDAETLGAVHITGGLIYSVNLKSDADAIVTSKAVEDAVDKLNQDGALKSVHIVKIYSVGDSVGEQIAEIRGGALGGPLGTSPFKNLGWILGGIQLVVLAMLLFVNWRAALISAVAIPLSLLFTMLALKLEGVTLNTLTLFSMILVLGLIVDPAIVVLEAIQREMDLGKRGKDAVIAALNTVGSGVFMAVFTSIIVFVPFGVVSGIFGQIIKYIPLTVLPALLASYFVPLLFLTYLAQRYLRPSKVEKDDEEETNLWRSSQWFIKANRAILRRTWLQVVIILAAVVVPFGVTGYLFATGKVVPVQFSQQDDVRQINISITYPRNLPRTTQAELVAKVEPILKNTPEILNYIPVSESDSSTTLFMTLLKKANRSRTSTQIIANLQRQFDKLSDAKQLIYYSAVAQGIGVPTSDYPVAVNIYGDNLAALKKAALKTGDILRQEPKVTRVDDGFTNVSNPQFELIVDRNKVAAAGLSVSQVAQSVAGLVGENTVTRFDQQIDGASRGTDVVLVNASQPTSLAALKDIIVGMTTHGPVKVSDVAAVGQSEGFTGIQHLNGSRYVTVQAKVVDALKDATAPQKAVKDYWTTDHLTQFGLRSDALQDKGSANQFVTSFKELFMALAISVVLTYFVFVLFFRSFMQPFIILFAIPLSFVGAFPALAFIGGQFGFLEILGVIVLVSIVENVGIFLIDLANRKRALGMPTDEAVAEASGIRFRAIFLTKVTALGGLLPLIIISPLWRPLAVIVTAGIITSGVLSLFTTPILYAWIIRLGERRHQRQHRLRKV